MAKKENHEDKRVKSESTVAMDKPVKAHRFPFFIIAFVLAVAATIFALFAIFKINDAKHQLASIVQPLVMEVDNIRDEQHALAKRIATQQVQLDKNKQDVKQSFNLINDNLDALMSQSPSKEGDWLLLKAQYYLQIAQINAYWQQHVGTTIALLQEADLTLSQVHNHKLFSVRQSFAKEIAILKALPQHDLTGLLTQLDALQTLAGDAPMRQTQASFTDKTSGQQTESETTNWRERFHKNLHLLERLVIILPDDDESNTLLSHTKALMVRERIRLSLEQAKWAAIHHNQNVYNAALKQATMAAHTFFLNKASATADFLKQIDALSSKSVSFPSTNINESLSQLTQIIQTNKQNTHRQSTGDSNP